MTKTKRLRLVTGLAAFAPLVGLVGIGVMVIGFVNLTKGVIVGDNA